MNEIIICRVEDSLDMSLLLPLVNESLNEGHLHLQRLIRDYESGSNLFEQPGEALFIAYRDSAIVGVCGLNRDPYDVNGADIGRVRRLYVTPQARRLGVGRMLMDAVLTEARRHYKLLVLRTTNPAADLFYRSLGFSVEIDSDSNSHFLQLT